MLYLRVATIFKQIECDRAQNDRKIVTDYLTFLKFIFGMAVTLHFMTMDTIESMPTEPREQDLLPPPNTV